MSNETFEAHRCGTCFMWYGVPQGYLDERRKDGVLFYCPNGHGRHYQKSESQEDILRRERDRLKQQLAHKDDLISGVARDIDDQKQIVKTTKAKLTRHLNRSAAGVCPCCNRTFEQLARHMKTKHAGFVAENVVPLRSANP